MNKVILQGRLVSDPTYTQRDSFAVVNFTIAVNRRFKDKSTGTSAADFISCQAFNHNADLIKQYFSKGSLILVVGEWRTGTYEKDGVKNYTNRCQVNEFYFQPNTASTHNDGTHSDIPVIAAGAPIQPNSRVKHETPPVQQNMMETFDTIPQAFDADIDIADEFPW